MSAGWIPRTDTPRGRLPWGCSLEVDRLPQPGETRRWVTFEDAGLDSSPEMTLKSAVWSQPVEGDQSPSPSSDSDKTTEMVDLTQPMEGDDCFSLSGKADETVDWSQPAGGDFGDPPVLDSHI